MTSTDKPKYLLDTCVLISVLRNKDGIQERIIEAGLDKCAISELTLAELYFGVYRKGNDKWERESVRKLSELFRILPVDNVADKFAREHERLRKEGSQIPDIDLLLGTYAVTHKMTIVTGNVKHLEKIEGIKIENWYQRTER